MKVSMTMINGELVIEDIFEHWEIVCSNDGLFSVFDCYEGRKPSLYGIYQSLELAYEVVLTELT